MRKLVVILLILFYGVSSSGMTLYIHYCCGKIDSIDLAPIKKNDCDMGHKKPMKNCCEDKGISFKISTDQKSENSTELLAKNFQVEKTVFETRLTTIRLPGLINTGFTDSSPPYNLSSPLYILNCIFLI